MTLSAEKQLVSDIQHCAVRSASLLEFIDSLLDHGISTQPRMKAGLGMITLRFQRGETSLTRSEAGIRLEGPLSYTVTHHDHILRYMEHAHRRGEPQEKILDEAAELRLPIQTAEPPELPSLQFMGRLQKIETLAEDCPDETLRGLTFGYDAWCHKTEEDLRKSLGEEVLPGIEALDEPHRLAALRWSCRIQAVERMGYGISTPQETALRRQRAILRHIGQPPEASAEDAAPTP